MATGTLMNRLFLGPAQNSRILSLSCAPVDMGGVSTREHRSMLAAWIQKLPLSGGVQAFTWPLHLWPGSSMYCVFPAMPGKLQQQKGSCCWISCYRICTETGYIFLQWGTSGGDQPIVKYFQRNSPPFSPPPRRSSAISGDVFWFPALPGGQHGYKNYPWVEEGKFWIDTTFTTVLFNVLCILCYTGQAATAKGQVPTVLCQDLHTWIHWKFWISLHRPSILCLRIRGRCSNK